MLSNPEGHRQSEIDLRYITGRMFHKGILQVAKAIWDEMGPG